VIAVRVLARLGIAGSLAAVVLAAHGGALNGGFHYDDQPTIVGNPAIRSWQPLFYWTSPFAVSGEVGAEGYYRPLTVATFAANYALGRLDPFGYLVMNLVLHIAVSWMVYGVGCRLLGDWRWALVAAVVFALHPVNAEAVNYIVARSSLLAALGALAAFWAFLRWRDGGGWAWPVLGAAVFAAALFSKESAVALIIPMWAYHWVGEPSAESGDGRRSRFASLVSSVVPTLPWSAVLAVYLAGWWTLVAAAGREGSVAVAAYPVWSVAELVCRSLGLWVWPWPLGLEHSLTFASRFDPWLAAGLVAAGLGGVVAGTVLWRRARLAAWSLIWVFAGFAPLLPLPWLTTKGLFQENRLAFSAVGLAWLTAMAARAIVVRLCVGGGRARFARGAAATIGALVAVGAVGMDRARSAVWNDDRRLWQEAVTHDPDNRGAHLNLGVAHMNRTQFDLAEDEFRRALAVSPGYPRAYYALGQLALRRERYDEAREWLLRTLAVVPDYPNTHYVLGEVERKQGRVAEAEAAFRRTVELNPRDARAHERLGLLAQQAGHDAAAETSYRAALQYNPDSAIARNNLGTIYLKRKDWPRALEQFTFAARRDPTDVDVALNRMMALAALGRKEDARAAAEALLRTLPPDARFDAHRRAAEMILEEGRS
jgi:tetratricopeptide (TPR) repeat protein